MATASSPRLAYCGTSGTSSATQPAFTAAPMLVPKQKLSTSAVQKAVLVAICE